MPIPLIEDRIKKAEAAARALDFVYRDSDIDLPALANVLRAEVEALALNPPLYSKHAYSPRRVAHEAFENGAVKVSAEHNPRGMPLEMCVDMVACATLLRGNIAGEAVLIWRHEPEFDEQGNVYMRLCFEPVP